VTSAPIQRVAQSQTSRARHNRQQRVVMQLGTARAVRTLMSRLLCAPAGQEKRKTRIANESRIVMVVQRSLFTGSFGEARVPKVQGLPLVTPPRWMRADTTETTLKILRASQIVSPGELARRCRMYFQVYESDNAAINVSASRHLRAALPPNGILLWSWCLLHGLHLSNGETLLVLDPKPRLAKYR
jgi:hypothetical protein